MAIQDKHILSDCLETLKHLGMNYQSAAFECDSDQLRKTLENIQIDKDELRNAVFNLMHQMGDYKNKPADTAEVTAQCRKWQQALDSMQQQMSSAVLNEDPSRRQYSTT